MILVPDNKVEKIKYFSTLLGLIFIEITRGPSTDLHIIVLSCYDNEIIFILGILSINGSQLAKMKKSIPDMSLP